MNEYDPFNRIPWKKSKVRERTISLDWPFFVALGVVASVIGVYLVV